MTGTMDPSTQPAFDQELRQRKKVAREFMLKQKRSDCWKLIPGSAPVSLVNHRSGMCRWPIGNPHPGETFLLCGCACSTANSYCKTHQRMAFAAYRPRTHR